MLDWSDGIRITFLHSKLRGSAKQFLDDYLSRHGVSATNYESVTKALRDRFHSNETRELYVQELNNCIVNPGEPILDYTNRVIQLFDHAHPLEDRSNEAANLFRDRLLKDIVIKGLPAKLKSKVQHKQFNSILDLAHAANRYAVNYDNDTRATPECQYVNAVSSDNGLARQLALINESLHKLLIEKETQSEQRKNQSYRYKNTKSGRQSYDGQRNRRLCDLCGNIGHDVRDCRLKNC